MTIFIKRIFTLFFFFVPFISQSQVHQLEKILVKVPGELEETRSIAIRRLEEYSEALLYVAQQNEPESRLGERDLTIIIGVAGDSPETEKVWQARSSAEEDAYLLQTLSKDPLVVVASGNTDRGMLYAVYQLADRIRSGCDLSDLDLFFQPRIKERYVLIGSTTHGRRYYRPALHYKSLKELPRYGYNGVIVYPGGGTPVARHSSPVMESEEGELFLDEDNTRIWKNWFREIKSYGHSIMMAVPPLVPPGYDRDEVRDFYIGGPEPRDYLMNLKNHFEKLLEMLTTTYPEIDRFMFNSTEGATFGNNKRFFEHPRPERFSLADYMISNERIMKAYFDVLQEFFEEEQHRVSFWTHSFGLTSDGIRKMREILFQYPEIMIMEDDFWNNNLWPFDLPAMKYLPEDLREEISGRNPFALFQIASDGEYYGGGSLPNAYPGSHILSAREAVDRGAEMVIQRLDLHDRTPYGTLFGTMEIVPLAAAKQLWEPTPDEGDIWREWAERRFGKEAAPFVINALKESENIIQNGLSCNGIDLLAVGSEFQPRLWIRETSLSRFWLFSRPQVRMVQKDEENVIFSEDYTAYQMNTHTISIGDFRENQQSALQSVTLGLQEIEKAKSHLSATDYAMLEGIFQGGRNVLQALSILGEAAYGANLLLDNFDGVENPEMVFEKAIRNLEKFIDEDQLIPEMTKNLRTILNNYKKVGEEI